MRNSYFILVLFVLFLTGCSHDISSRATIPSSLASYNDVFNAATELVTNTGFTVSRADKATGMISGVKQIEGDDVNYYLIIKNNDKSEIEINLIREYGKVPPNNSVWKAYTKHMLTNISKMINVPENKIVVIMKDSTIMLDQL
jgi:outer membrane lipopolysaccharide assembly protein LptE/RlpB